MLQSAAAKVTVPDMECIQGYEYGEVVKVTSCRSIARLHHTAEDLQNLETAQQAAQRAWPCRWLHSGQCLRTNIKQGVAPASFAARTGT